MKILITIPAYNEELTLESTIQTISTYLTNYSAEALEVDIEIADNGSVDKTAEIGVLLAQKYPNVFYMRSPEAGKGLAIQTSWLSHSGYDLYIFMDADLSTDLSVLPLMIDAYKKGYHVIMGSRIHRNSKVNRPLIRKVQTRVYNTVMRALFGLKVKDLQIGCKAISSVARDMLLNKVTDKRLFFDTQLLVLAEKSGFEVAELPIIYHDDRHGRMPPAKVASKLLSKALSLKLALIRNDFNLSVYTHTPTTEEARVR